jgi:uncharacterized membrane protein
VVLGICIFGVFKLLKKLEVKINPEFILQSFHSYLRRFLRVLEDLLLIYFIPLQLLAYNPEHLFLVFGITGSACGFQSGCRRQGL